MDMSVTQIDSNKLIPIEQHFKVEAGPGAGKTHWLINHIKNVLHKSSRLGVTKKIACITYTNVAADTIRERLGVQAYRVEVSTIHSFIYRNIVKPYVKFIANDYNLNFQKMDGHDEHRVSRKKVNSWIENHSNKGNLKHPYTENQLCRLTSNQNAIARWLESLSYVFNFEDIIITCDKKQAYYIEKNGARKYLSKDKCLAILEPELLSYKKLHWSEGKIHHEDVLYFGYQLLQKYPFILQVIRAKFPYFFVDEFQDTNPIQTKILEQIGKSETIVGIIGDKAQSIYEFQGAGPSQFGSFMLPSMVSYEIQDNKRSTGNIVKLLNAVRKDMTQQHDSKNGDGEKPILIVSDMIAAIQKAQEFCKNEDICSLSRDNITSNAMKKNAGAIPSSDLLLGLRNDDSNHDRTRVIIACIQATELARYAHFKESIKELEIVFKDEDDKNERRKLALRHIHLFLKEYSHYSIGSLYEYYLCLQKHVSQETANVTRGNVKNFYENHTYQELALGVKIVEDKSLHRTIHKAKGSEFDNVLLVLKEESDLAFILNPDLGNKEEQRVNYVAVSRARKRLFITVPSLSGSKRKALEKLDVISII